MLPTVRLLTLLAAPMLAVGCATTGHRSTGAAKQNVAAAAPTDYVRPCPVPPVDATSAFECDRRSILAMAGEFRVTFAFDESQALAPGYVPHAAQRSGGTEWVFVVEDQGTSIALQHILVVGPEHTVVKHWRQDWRYQPADILLFRGHDRFERVAVDPDRANGAWSQTVFEVDDAPRYAGIGRWSHANGVDAWTSDFTWRPLPRREYTKRSDYHVLGAINRHTLTPQGWMHEQDNLKLVLADDGSTHALVREVGVNTYSRVDDVDFSAGKAYWERTGEFWRTVRHSWQRALAAPASDIVTSLDGKPRFEALFALAEKVGPGTAVSQGDVEQILARAIRPLTAATSGAASGTSGGN
ncbi:DUF6607 family protein [Tahibacter amnicola]|uniref:Secreted protein n=1 Tax=Tahibacter amnicola TaxID=2976241 RepID=A0ABY6BE99_9GAMM|nr:DUF6607 family protein [Tahibacter amnicola]UXI67573.1 hypothetical protein N4264_23000 [Tahibacter amnicola]